MMLSLLLSGFLAVSSALPSGKAIDDFKSKNAIVANVDLSIQELNGGGFLSSAGFVDIANAMPYSVSSATSGTGRLSRGQTSSGQPFLVVRDEAFNIRRVVVSLADGSLTTFRRVEGSFFAEVSPDVSRTITNTRTGEDAKIVPSRLRQLRKKVLPSSQNDRQLQTACSEFYELEVAIGYDHTFCDDYSSKAVAEQTIENVVAEASMHYEKPGLCTRLTLVHIEGYCNQANDPYYTLYEEGTGLSGCGSDGMLDDFGDFWEANRSNVHRDVAHLFQGRDFVDSNTVGCAWVGALCSRGFGYGVNAVSWVWDETLMASLFAHELGHNCDASHVSDGSKEFIMESPVNMARDSFASTSSSSMFDYISNRASCVTTVPTAPTPPTPTAPTPTPPTPTAPTPTPPTIQLEPGPSPPSNCFSGENTLEVKGKGSVLMKDLAVGDSVLTKEGGFSRVYSLAHNDDMTEHLYWQIHATSTDKESVIVLEVSDEHFVLANGKYTTASELQVSDMLTGLGDQQTLVISSIARIKRQGLYAPFTESGDLIVSGVAVSSYVRFLDASVVDQHALVHWFVSPVRSYCRFRPSSCEEETYTDGISNLFLPMARLVWTVQKMHHWFHFVSSVVVLPIVWMISLMERSAVAAAAWFL